MGTENEERNGMVKVDPKLFITCRLCLNNTGLYQIVPKIQNQIKYCFDIEVELFDGLPPLICKQCESILSKYVAIKQMFQEKQNTLRTKLKSDWVNDVPEDTVVEPAQETVSSTQQIESGSSIFNNEHQDEDKNTAKCISTTTLEAANPVPFGVDEVKSNITIKLKNWKAKFVKHFACRFCTKTYKDKRSIHNHIKNKHSNILSSHTNVFKKYCLVRLDKLDHKANITGSKKMVHMQNKIIQNKKAHYYITYLAKSTKPPNSESSSTDEDEVTVNRKKRKTRRLSSTSSTDTLVIDKTESRGSNHSGRSRVVLSEKEGATNEDTNVANIVYWVDDSDSTMSSHSHKESELTSDDQNKKINNDIITNIVKMCHERFLKKIEEAEDKQTNIKNKVDKESQIQHKVLSIGCKVINNKGFQCTGLLRYLEHKNLEVICIPKTTTGVSKDSHYIRIKTKLREKKENENSGWQNFGDVLNTDTNLVFSDVLQKALVSVANAEPEVFAKSIETPIIEEEIIARIYTEDHAVLSKNYCSELEKHLMSQKLLNENPVANPKQLPKKASNNETKVCYLTTNAPIDNISVENHMPIITSIESLANVNVHQHDNLLNTVVEKSKPAAQPMSRIKVKPVSELMPKKPEMSSPSLFYPPTANSWNPNQHIPVQDGNIYNMTNTNQFCAMNMGAADIPQYTKIAPKAPVQHTVLLNQNTEVAPQEPSPSVSNDNKYVILHTVELPNKKTSSPFSYFKLLLQMHDIILVGTDEPLSPHSISLIKLKLLFQQKLTTPLTLCLELYSDIKTFCIKIRDCNFKDIDINKLNAHWQLEILEVFSGDVTTNKILSRAQKANQQMYERTTYFISLLKSIQKVSDDRLHEQHLSDNCGTNSFKN